MRKGYILILIIISAITSLFGQDNLSIQASIDRSEMLTGQQANILLKVRTNDIKNTKIYNSKSDSDNSFKILEYIPSDTIDVDGVEKELSINVLITSFDSTIVTIPPFIVKTTRDSVESKALSIKIVQPDVDFSNKNNIASEKGLWDVNLTFYDYLKMIFSSMYFYMVVIAVLVIILLYFIFVRMKNKSRLKVVEEPVAVLTAIEKAKQSFELLDTSDCFYNRDYKHYYTRRFDIMRTYMQDRLEWNALEMTNNDILSCFEKYFGSQKELISKIEDIITVSDLVKFAKYTPTNDDMEYFRNITYQCCEIIESVVSKEDETK